MKMKYCLVLVVTRGLEIAVGGSSGLSSEDEHSYIDHSENAYDLEDVWISPCNRLLCGTTDDASDYTE